MCLIIRQKADTVWTDEFLQGVFKKNKDGLGAMYAENDVLYYVKSLPKSFADVKAFWEDHVVGRECAIHFRMQTHGDIDTTNCHPYEVLKGNYPLYLMHNGILHTDNMEDQSKSDTFLYIKNYLRPMLEKNPEWFMSEHFQELVSSHIGRGNKFVLLDAYGNMVTINEEEGVEYNGAWLSNTYAWDTTGTEYAPKVYPRFASPWSELGKYNVYTPSQLKNPVGAVSTIPTNYAPLRFDGPGDYPEDAVGFARDLFATLRDAGMDTAWKALTHQQARDYYEDFGETAWDVLEAIELGSYTDEELIDEITNGMTEWKKEVVE